MNYYAIVNGINSLCALVIALVIIFRRTRKAVQLTYAFFYFLLFLWASCYFIWGIQKDLEPSMFWMQLLEYPVCFIHVAYLHFTLLFSETYHKYKKYLTAGYALSFMFVIVNSQKGYFDMSYIRDKSPFHYWPHGTSLLTTFIAFQLICVLLSFIILFRTIQVSQEPLKTRLKLFSALAIIGWTGGLTNWFNFYDATPVAPVGNPAVTIYLIGTAYLIFKHDLLGLNLAIKRTFVYTTLTLSISLIYALFVALSEKMFQSYMGYSSLIGSFAAALFIAAIFNPLRNILSRWIDKRFFGKSIEELSKENVQMRYQLQNQDRMRAVATLAAGMAHEIKNPLTSIKTFAEYLPKKYDDPEFRQKFSRVVVDEVDRVNNIVKQLLEFSKPSELQLKAVLVADLLEETLGLLNNNMLRQGIQLGKDFDRYAMIMADKNQLKQALLNLFLNAIQSIADKGKLQVSARSEPNGYVRIAISDTGCGMTKEQMRHMFDPFYTTKEDGTGLGLAIVHSIITKHGGKIEIQSEEGRGTTVNVFLKSRD